MENKLEFTISKSELSRRVTAYTTLMASLLAGLLIAFYFSPVDRRFAVLFLVIILILAVNSRWLLIRFFNNYERSKVILDTLHLERIGLNSEEKIAHSEIDNIFIRRTTRKTIREIKIVPKSGKPIYLNAIDHMEQLKDELIKRCGNKARVSESCEHIDYDHPAFYLILGLVIGLISVWFIGTLLSADDRIIGTINFAESTFSTALGLYVVIAKPLAKYYGKKRGIADLILGLIMISIGILAVSSKIV